MYKELRKELIERNMTAKELAQRIGMAESALSMRMSGKREFRSYEILKISKVLQLSKDRVMAIFFGDQVG